MYGVNEDRYWMQVQAKYEHWYDEDNEENEGSNNYTAWDEADLKVDEALLNRGR